MVNLCTKLNFFILIDYLVILDQVITPWGKNPTYQQYAPGIFETYYAICSQGERNDCKDCFCYYYDLAFGYAKDHNLTLENVYDQIYSDLLVEDSISSGLSNIRNKMESNSGRYNISAFLEKTSDQWLVLEKFEALFSIAAKTPLKLPINFARTVMENFGGYSFLEAFTQQEFDELYNMFMLEDDEFNLMAISHLYTMNDFGQLGRSDLFSLKKEYFINKLSLGGVPEAFKVCFKQLYNEYFSDDEGPADEIPGYRLVLTKLKTLKNFKDELLGSLSSSEEI